MMAELSLIAKTTLILAVALFATRAAQRASASVRSLILAAGFGLVLLLPIASAIAPSREVQIPDVYASRFLIAEETVDRPPEYVGAPQRPAAEPTSVVAAAIGADPDTHCVAARDCGHSPPARDGPMASPRHSPSRSRLAPGPHAR